jgi:signal transduction histidine kinase
VSYSRWKTRQATYYLAIVRDITERRHAEQRLKLFSTTMLAAREEEKRRLSMNLHDELGALAVTLGGHVCSIRDGLRTIDAGEPLQELERLTGCFKAGIGRLRTIAVDLRPPELDMVGLPAALQAICASARKSGGMHVEADITLHQATLSEDAAIALYRVVQEAFNNIVRHSGAQRARLSVVGRTTAVQCRVHDNGIGFAVQPAAPQCRQATLGLLGMRERIELLGGSFHIESSPGCGTDISFTLPAAAFP